MVALGLIGLVILPTSQLEVSYIKELPNLSWRNYVHFGFAALACMGIIAINAIWELKNWSNMTFWLEAIGFWLSGAAWLVKAKLASQR